MNTLRICALFHDRDEHYLQNFVEAHKRLNCSMFLCKVESNCESDTINFQERESPVYSLLKMTLKEFSFSVAKNKVLQYLTVMGAIDPNDLVLFLDIDEELTGSLELLSEAINNLLNDNKAGGIKVKIASFNGYNEDFTDSNIVISDAVRIFRAKYRFDGSVHEQISYDIERDGKHIIPSRLLIQHYGYLDGKLNAIKLFRNLQLLCKDISNGYEADKFGAAKQYEDLIYLDRTLEDLKKMGYYDSNIR